MTDGDYQYKVIQEMELLEKWEAKQMTMIQIEGEERNEMWIPNKIGEQYEQAIENEKQRKQQDEEEWANYQGE